MALHKHKTKPRTKAAKKAKVKTVLGEHKRGTLRSSSGAKVTNRKQAVAIALSEADLSREGRKKATPAGSRHQGTRHKRRSRT